MQLGLVHLTNFHFKVKNEDYASLKNIKKPLTLLCKESSERNTHVCVLCRTPTYFAKLRPNIQYKKPLAQKYKDSFEMYLNLSQFLGGGEYQLNVILNSLLFVSV